MKNIGLILGLFIVVTVAAQEDFNETLAVPLSKPGARGSLEVSIIRGDITVTAYDGDDVVIIASAKQSDCNSCEEKKSAPSGMKRISSGGGIEISASEENNRVEIETNSWNRPLNLEIKVPKNFDLQVGTVHGGVTVDGVEGTMEVSATHGPLSLTNLSGSMLSNTAHGDIIATFNKIDADEPMAFITLHGNVDVTFPAGVKATAKMKSDRGEIFTDFDMEVTRSKAERKTGDHRFEVSLNSWVVGEIGGGGPEYTFKNMHGDIYIRKK